MYEVNGRKEMHIQILTKKRNCECEKSSEHWYPGTKSKRKTFSKKKVQTHTKQIHEKKTTNKYSIEKQKGKTSFVSAVLSDR